MIDESECNTFFDIFLLVKNIALNELGEYCDNSILILPNLTL